MSKLAFVIGMYVVILGIGLIEAKHKLKKMTKKEQEKEAQEDNK